jgi:hypothetical protein
MMGTHYDLNEQIKPELLSRLARQAKAQGETVNGLLGKILGDAEATSAQDDEVAPAEMSPQDRAKAWREWTANHSVLAPHPVDVSRESIYTREDEAL